MEIAALVLGIVSLVLVTSFGWTGIGAIIALIGAIVGIVLAALSIKKAKAESAKHGKATAGLVMSIVALVFSVIFTVSCLICGAAVNKGVKEIKKLEENGELNLSDLQKQLEKAFDDYSYDEDDEVLDDVDLSDLEKAINDLSGTLKDAGSDVSKALGGAASDALDAYGDALKSLSGAFNGLGDLF